MSRALNKRLPPGTIPTVSARAKYYIVVDLEATTSDDGSLPPEQMETIEIGAVLTDARTLAIVDEFQSFVRPVRRPRLHPFVTKLTGITQAMVDDAPLFPEAFGALRARLIDHRHPLVWASWGRYDRIQFERDCGLHGIPSNMPPHLNLKVKLSEVQGLKKKLGMAQALKLCGLPLEGTHHRGIDDARNIARMLPWIVGERRIGKRRAAASQESSAMIGQEDRYKPLLARRVPRDSIVLGRAYVIHARNGGVGVAVEKNGCIGYRLHRTKFTDHYLFVEYDWAEDPQFGTAIPLRLIEAEPPTGDEELLAWLANQQEEYRAEIDAAWEVVLGFPPSRLRGRKDS